MSLPFSLVLRGRRVQSSRLPGSLYSSRRQRKRWVPTNFGGITPSMCIKIVLRRPKWKIGSQESPNVYQECEGGFLSDNFTIRSKSFLSTGWTESL